MKSRTYNKFIFCLIGGLMTLGSTMANEDEELALNAQKLLSEQIGQGIEIATVSVEHITWPNGAMGCPKAGMNYTQALVEGYRVILKANGRNYSYHGREGGAPFYCANPESSHGWIQDR